MIAFAVFVAVASFVAIMLWVNLNFVGHKTEVEVDNALVGVGLILSAAFVITGGLAIRGLLEETTPHYYPMIINVPVLAEKP